MSCCCSRYTTGITLGSLYIIGSVLFFVFELILYIQYDNNVEDPERKKDLKYQTVEAMIMCGVAVLISSLFIVGIVKRWHYLILPWLLFAFYVFYATLGFMYLWFIGAGIGGAPGVVFIVLILIAVGSVAAEIAIFCFSCCLFNEIRLQNMEKSERVDQQMYGKNLI